MDYKIMEFKGPYFCDPVKNTPCTKTSCFINGGPCSCTTHEEYALKEAGLYILQAETFLTDEEITILQDNINAQLKNANKGDKILDTHVGSGSSLMACHNLGFDYIGYEIDEAYYKQAKARIEENAAQLRFIF